MNRFLKTIALPIILISSFFFIDERMKTLSESIFWIAFFPLRTIEWASSVLQLRENHAILLSLSLGVPLLFLYWYVLVRYALKIFQDQGENEERKQEKKFHTS